jgi:hypothetical protein
MNKDQVKPLTANPTAVAESSLHGVQSNETQSIASDMDQSGRQSQPEILTGRSLAQILIVLVVLLAVVNIPINQLGFGLAHLKTETRPIVIYDGMLLKGSGPELYLLDDHKLRLISNPTASGRYFRLQNVRTVEDRFLEQFGQGPPIRYLIKCNEQPDIYAIELENGRQKRLVQQPPPTGTKRWDQIHTVSCDFLHNLPDGPPITDEVEAAKPLSNIGRKRYNEWKKSANRRSNNLFLSSIRCCVDRHNPTEQSQQIHHRGYQHEREAF